MQKSVVPSMKIPFEAQEPSRLNVGLVLGGLTLLGLVLRLGVAWITNQQLPDTPARLAGDEPGYDQLAWGLLNGSVFQWPGRTPVYPLFLAACYLVFGHSYAAALYVQAVINATVVPLTYSLARQFTGHVAAFAAAGIIALDLAQSKAGLLYSEALYTPLFLAAILVLVQSLKARRLHRFLPAGVLLGIANLCRPTATLLPAVVPFIMPSARSIRTRLAAVVIYGASMAAVILPWTAHNYFSYHVFLPLDSVEGAWLWAGSPEAYHLLSEERTAMLQQRQAWLTHQDVATATAQLPLNKLEPDFSTIEGNDRLRSRALASIEAEPGVFVWYSIQKLVYFWVGNPYHPYDWPFDLQAIQFYLAPWQIAGVMASRMIPIVALMSLIVLRRELSRYRPLLFMCGYFMLIHSIGDTEARYSEPLHSVLAIFIGAAVTSVWLWLRAYRPAGRRGQDEITSQSQPVLGQPSA